MSLRSTANKSLHRSVFALVWRASVRTGEFAPAARVGRCSRPGELNL